MNNEFKNVVFDGNKFKNKNFEDLNLNQKKTIIAQLKNDINKANESNQIITIMNFNIDEKILENERNKDEYYISLNKGKEIIIENTNIIKEISSSIKKISLNKVKLDNLSIDIETKDIPNILLPEMKDYFFIFLSIPFIFFSIFMIYLTYFEQLNLNYILNLVSVNAIGLETYTIIFDIIKYYFQYIIFSVLILIILSKWLMIIPDKEEKLEKSKFYYTILPVIIYSFYLQQLDIIHLIFAIVNHNIIIGLLFTMHNMIMGIIAIILNIIIYCNLTKTKYKDFFTILIQWSFLINFCFLFLLLFKIINENVATTFTYSFLITMIFVFIINSINYVKNKNKETEINFFINTNIKLLKLNFISKTNYKKEIPKDNYFFQDTNVNNFKYYKNNEEINKKIEIYIKENKTSDKFILNFLKGVNLILSESIITHIYKNNFLSEQDYKYLLIFHKKCKYLNINSNYKSYFKLYWHQLSYNLSYFFKYGDFNLMNVIKYFSIVLFLGFICFFKESNMIVSDNLIMSNTINNNYDNYCSMQKQNCKEMILYNEIEIPMKDGKDGENYNLYQYYYMLNNTLVNLNFISHWYNTEISISKHSCPIKMVNCIEVPYYEQVKVKIPNFYLEYNSFLYTIGLLIPIENSQTKSFMPNNWIIEKIELLYKILGYILWAMILSKISFYIGSKEIIDKE